MRGPPRASSRTAGLAKTALPVGYCSVALAALKVASNVTGTQVWLLLGESDWRRTTTELFRAGEDIKKQIGSPKRQNATLA